MQRRRPSGTCDVDATGPTHRKGTVRAVLEAVVPALAVVVLTRVFLVGLYRVPTASMEPAIQIGDCILGERVSYHMRQPRAGEVVTLESPEEPGVTLVKRVVATEGQAVDVRDGRVFVDGRQLDEPYAKEGQEGPSGSGESDAATVTYPHVVAEGCVWVMGDNRANSRDSRSFGDVPVASMSSRVLCAYWPPERVGPVP